ncbi:hypothetical protein HWV01_08650 [Moritella sp. 5]|uniref:hypothetical protein n=1 Tax=Moritella sp. 5 TaxID=2746231 RepID=UPI001BA54C27|nr:hypothetical protein [Moritella sp. 5]QUM80349.1 hypothetical protein HWV01_08650 [Moritella sp. 5]
MNKIILLTFSILIVSGCATNATAPSYAEAPLPEVTCDKAILYVFRDYAEPTAWSSYLLVDGKEVISLQQEGFTWVYLAPGDRQFINGWSALAGMPDVKFNHSIEAGKLYSFEMKSRVAVNRTSITSTTEIDLLSFDEAEKRLKLCCRYVAPTDMKQ